MQNKQVFYISEAQKLFDKNILKYVNYKKNIGFIYGSLYYKFIMLYIL